MTDPGHRGYPTATMRRARQLAATGIMLTEIREALEHEGHGKPSGRTIATWVAEERAEIRRQQLAAAQLALGPHAARFRLDCDTPDDRLAFMRLLRSQGVSCRAIGVVAGVVFGEALTHNQVSWLFRGGDPKPGPVTPWYMPRRDESEAA